MLRAYFTVGLFITCDGVYVSTAYIFKLNLLCLGKSRVYVMLHPAFTKMSYHLIIINIITFLINFFYNSSIASIMSSQSVSYFPKLSIYLTVFIFL